MSLMRYAGAVVSPFNQTIMHPPTEEGAFRVTGEGQAMPQCHPVTYKSKEAKSQVSPSGASTDPAPLLGAIIGASYLNSVFVSIHSVFDQAGNYHSTKTLSPASTLLQSDGIKGPFINVLTLQQSLMTRNLYLKGRPLSHFQRKIFASRIFVAAVSFHSTSEL